MKDNPDIGGGDNATVVAAGKLRKFIERIERLEEEKKTIGGDIKEIYLELKGEGYDVKTVRKIVRLRGMDQSKMQAEASLLGLYVEALGMKGVFG